MPSSKWITAEQHTILSKYDELWAGMLADGSMLEVTDRFVRDISDTHSCIVTVLHGGDWSYGKCHTCKEYSINMNQAAQSKDENIGSKQFRNFLGGFLSHYETEHKDLIRK